MVFEARAICVVIDEPLFGVCFSVSTDTMPVEKLRENV